jgi:hypothetical protein
LPEGLLGPATVVAGLALAITAIVRTRPTHPLWWPIVASCVALVFYSADVLAPERNASRVFLPVMVLSIVALTTRKADRGLLAAAARPSAVT